MTNERSAVTNSCLHDTLTLDTNTEKQKITIQWWMNRKYFHTSPSTCVSSSKELNTSPSKSLLNSASKPRPLYLSLNIFTMFLRFQFLQDNINCFKCDGVVRLWVALNIAPNFLQLQSSVWWGFKTPKKPRSIIAALNYVFAPDYLLWGEFRQVPTPICSLYAGIYSTCFKSVQYQVLSS